MAPSPPQSGSGSPDTLHAFISHNPALFYVVVVFCCVCLVCGTIYLLGAVHDFWKVKEVQYAGDNTECGAANQTDKPIDVEDSWLRKLQTRLARGPAKSKVSDAEDQVAQY